VADAICSPGRRVIFPEWPDADYWSSDLNEALLSHCTRVNYGAAPHQQDIMPVGDEELTGAEVAQRLAEHIGPQRLPFDRMWFEGTWPGTVGDFVAGAAEVAVYASTQMRNKDTGNRLPPGEFALTPYFLMNDGSIARLPLAVRMVADEDGNPQRIRYAPYADNYTTTNDQDRVGLALVLPTMWAIGLMNCRNVKTTEVTRAPIRTKKMRRVRDSGLLSYHTIGLPRQAGEGGERGGMPTGRTRLHMVRGHFATYTGEAPLFGKYTGTFWRPWHLAGNPEVGAVETDYKLDPTN
jgi:hypothetical protein